MRIWMVRHTSVAVKGTCYGQSDVALNSTFFDEAIAVRQKLQGIEPDLIYASPLSRCQLLADFCFPDKKKQYKDELKELNFGDWELKEWNSLDMSIWQQDWMNTPTPNGESFANMIERVSSFWNDLKKEKYNTVIVFTHGGVVNATKVYLEECTIEEAFDATIEYGGIKEFEL